MGFQLGRAAPDETRSRIQRVRAQLELPTGRPRLGRAALHLLFEPPAFLGQVHAHQHRRQLRQHPGRADHADHVGDGEGDRDAVAERRPLRLGQVEAGDGVHGGADGRRLRQRAGHQAGGGAGVVAEQAGYDPGNRQPGDGHDRRQGRMRQALAPQAAKELRAGPEPDGEQEQQEETLLDRIRQTDAELAHQHAGEQGAGDRTQLERAECDLAEQIAQPEHQEKGDLRVLAQRFEEPVHCVLNTG
ncbi:MAG: hypothetical protein MUE63_14230 [Xanthomonadales bacterium]|nr:hypothetical protein [Xanthomonadales bacterium]